MAHGIGTKNGIFQYVQADTEPEPWHRGGLRMKIVSTADLIEASKDAGIMPTEHFHQPAIDYRGTPKGQGTLYARFGAGGPQFVSAGICEAWLGYRDGEQRWCADVGKDHANAMHASDPIADVESLLYAAEEGGATPDNAFSLQGGNRIVFTFKVGTTGQGDDEVAWYLVICEDFTGSKARTVMAQGIRTVWQNTVHAAELTCPRGQRIKIRHSGDLSGKTRLAADAVRRVQDIGQDIGSFYQAMKNTKITNQDQFEAALARYVPPPAEDASDNAWTRYDNKRAAFIEAMRKPENNAGETVATLFNAATFLLDRNPDGTAIETAKGGASMAESMLFGSRNKQLGKAHEATQEVLKFLVQMADGTTQEVDVAQAVELGVEPGQLVDLDSMEVSTS